MTDIPMAETDRHPHIPDQMQIDFSQSSADPHRASFYSGKRDEQLQQFAVGPYDTAIIAVGDAHELLILDDYDPRKSHDRQKLRKYLSGVVARCTAFVPVKESSDERLTISEINAQLEDGNLRMIDSMLVADAKRAKDLLFLGGMANNPDPAYEQMNSRQMLRELKPSSAVIFDEGFYLADMQGTGVSIHSDDSPDAQAPLIAITYNNEDDGVGLEAFPVERHNKAWAAIAAGELAVAGWITTSPGNEIIIAGNRVLLPDDNPMQPVQLLLESYDEAELGDYFAKIADSIKSMVSAYADGITDRPISLTKDTHHRPPVKPLNLETGDPDNLYSLYDIPIRKPDPPARARPVAEVPVAPSWTSRFTLRRKK